MITSSSAVLNFSGSHLLPSSLMRQTSLHTKFGIQESWIPSRRGVTENVLLEISCIWYSESIHVMLAADPNCQRSHAVNKHFLKN